MCEFVCVCKRMCVCLSLPVCLLVLYVFRSCSWLGFFVVAETVELWGGDPLCWERAEYACPGYRECWTSICDVMCGFLLVMS